MIIGQVDYPIQEGILFLFLILSLIFNTFLFGRGHSTYSIKYQIMKKHKFFRVNQIATCLVQYIYKSFFMLPFAIIALISILRGVKNGIDLLPILINGLVVILIIYPSQREIYYIKYSIIWCLAVVSQLLSIFLSDSNPYSTSIFIQLSVIFYTTNAMIFCLAILNNQKVYWQLGEAIKILGKQKISQINSSWITQEGQDKLPDVFKGGLYGILSKNISYKPFLILYFVSMIVLGIYAFLVFHFQKSYLGISGFISTLIYDLFIMIFSSLQSSQRSIPNIFAMIFIGRLLTFCFGMQYWIFGYCLLYFGVGIFLGQIIINRRLPMKFQSLKKSTQYVNVIKTPEFVLLVLTIEIIILILFQEIANVTSANAFVYNNVQIKSWNFAIAIVILTWVIIFYMISVRLLNRHINKIRSMTSYYFGLVSITQSHMYVIVTYILIILLGIYCLAFLNDKNIFLACIFLPLIYLCIFQMGLSWVKNGYCILADTQQFNKKQFKKYQIKLQKRQILKEKAKKEKEKKKENNKMLYMKQTTTDAFNLQRQLSSLNSNSIGLFESKKIKVTKGSQLKQISEEGNSGIKLFEGKKQHDQKTNYQGSESQSHINRQIQQVAKQQQFIQLKDWRVIPMTLSETWNNLTKYDKNIIIFLLLFFVFSIIYSIISFIWAKSNSGLAFSLSIISLLSVFAYYKSTKSGQSAETKQILISCFCFLTGIIFWSISYTYSIAGIIWAAITLFFYGISMKSIIQKNSQKYLLAFMIVKIILVLIYVCLNLGFHYGIALPIIFLAILIAVLLGLLNFFYSKKETGIPLKLKIITLCTIVSIILAIGVAGFLMDEVQNYIVFTVISFLIFLALLSISLMISITKYNNRYKHPHVYSAFFQPIYRYQTQNQKLKSSMNHVILFQFSSIILVIYAAIMTLFFTQKFLGIYSLSLFLALQFTQINLRSISTYYYFGEHKNQITKQLVINSFNELKNKHMLDEVEGEDSPYYLKLFQDTKQKAEKAQTESEKDNLWKETVVLKQLVIKNIQQEQKFLFFWMALIMSYIFNERRRKMVDFIVQIKQIQIQLIQNGILIESINETQTVQTKFKLIQKQIDALPPLDFLIYKSILEKHKFLSEHKKKQLENLHKKQQQTNKQKEEQLFKKMKEDTVQGTVKIQQFNNLVKKLGKGSFTDEQFPPNQTSLGFLSSRVSKWRRPEPNQKLIAGDISAGDVLQGNIGDCYLISSFGVLGQQRINQAFGKSVNSTLWQNSKGAYMVRFYKFLKQVYVIVDDYLPSEENGALVFAKSQDKNQIWPSILQKAYAKLYSGYDKIVQGKCHRVLAEFTGGFPIQIQLKQYKSNPNGLWTKLINGKQFGYLLAAGSPSNARGDLAQSARGIVQGHAYSILDVKQIESHQLIKLKNPHGTQGIQWNGDFSDQSQIMDKRMMKLLGHEKKNDGIFWMTLDDFISQYRSLYICAVFDDKWKKIPPIKSQWNKQNSFGTPKMSDETYKNPQYGIKVNKKCSVFISLTQKSETSLKGKNSIYFRVQRNQQRRIHKQDISSDKQCGKPLKPIDAVTISQQIQLQNESYPFIFTLYICCVKDGEPGYGQYSLQIYCNDLEVQIIQDKKFDIQ